MTTNDRNRKWSLRKQIEKKNKFLNIILHLLLLMMYVEQIQILIVQSFVVFHVVQ
jgi:hypothetical protein